MKSRRAELLDQIADHIFEREQIMRFKGIWSHTETQLTYALLKAVLNIEDMPENREIFDQISEALKAK